MKAPFQPTACACRADRQNCTEQPGHLLPGQLREIAAHLGIAIEEARRQFWNSPGMLLADSSTGATFRVRTITPRYEDGKCVFYAGGRCTIHPVAPFGCRYFDVHMRPSKARSRSLWGARQILDRLDGYAAERDQLPEATHYRPKGFL